MLPTKINYTKKGRKPGLSPALLMLMFQCCFVFSLNAQQCPANIDFESGNFSGWTCYTGYTRAVDTNNVMDLSPSSNPIPGRHTLYGPRSTERDRYGNFPVKCPNGSGYSVKLGNTSGGGEAEGISYDFTIPENDNSYLLTYWYAVVFQAPHHQKNEQPRMETEIINLTDNKVISCASLTFIAMGNLLEGFSVNPDTIDVLYKKWSPVSIDLTGYAGKRIRLFFKTGDCTFRRHFGYAYVDVNSECNGGFAGATYCPGDSAVSIEAPAGYRSYAWFDSSGSVPLGIGPRLTLAPPPPSGTTVAVDVMPYEGLGCPATIITKIKDSLTIYANAGESGISCNGDPVQLGGAARPGIVYQWTPAEYLSNSEISNPIFVPGQTTTYTVKASSYGGGCQSTDTVTVYASTISNSLQLMGKDAFCFGHGDSAVLYVHPEQRIDWFKDDGQMAISNTQFSYRVTASGSYHAIVSDRLGCTVTTAKKEIIIDYDQPGITYPLKYAVIDLPLKLAARDFGGSVLWNPGDKLDNVQSITPVFTSNAEQFYNITITSRGGCVTIDKQMVKIVDRVKIFVPTAFTPNSDGVNDYLRPVFMGVAEIRNFRIYNRRGQVLFESKTELPGWDGTFKGFPQDPQTFVWALECVGVDGVFYKQQGTSILLR